MHRKYNRDSLSQFEEEKKERKRLYVVAVEKVWGGGGHRSQVITKRGSRKNNLKIKY